MVQLVGGAGAAGKSYLPLGGGAPLGPDGARRLAGLLCEARPPLLTRLDLRCCDAHAKKRKRDRLANTQIGRLTDRT